MKRPDHNIKVQHLNNEESDFIMIYWPHCFEVRHLPSGKWFGWTGHQVCPALSQFLEECHRLMKIKRGSRAYVVQSSPRSGSGIYMKLHAGDHVNITSGIFKYNREAVVNCILEGESLDDEQYYIPIRILNPY